jgi:MFS family permease
MTAKQAADEIRLSRVLLLLALSVFINYLDRGNLSIAAPLVKNEFQLSATQLGVLLSSFFWTYSFFLPVSGWLVDRLDVKWVIASGFFLWSAATAAAGAAHAFGTLLLARLALGARRVGVLSSMLDHFVAVFPGAQTWLRQCEHSCRYGLGASVRDPRWRNSDEPIWVAPSFSRGGPD